MKPLRRIDEDLWVADAPLSFLGLAVGTRMTVVRLPGDRLWLHSPIEATGALVEAVTALGQVAYLVAPNRFHHLFIESWQAARPEAETFIAPGLAKKRPELAATGLLEPAPYEGWKDVLDQVLVEGMPMIGEVVFFHRPTATLLLTDLAFNFDRAAPRRTRLVIGLIGQRDRLAPTVFERLATRDREALAASLRRILALPFRRVIVTHGSIVEEGGREQLESSYAWALRG